MSVLRNLLISWWRVARQHWAHLALYAVPILVQGALPLLTLPLTTLILTPEDYGIVGLVGVYISGAGLVASLGSGFQLAMVRIDSPRAHSVIKAVSLLSLLLSCIFAGGLYVLWWLTRQYYVLPNSISRTDIVIALIAMVLSTPWLVSRPLTVLQQRPRIFSIVSTCRILVATSSILVALFLFDQGRFSLFLGLLALGLVDFFGAMVVIWPSLRAPVETSLILETLRKGATISGSSITNMLFPILERSVLAGGAGPAILGLYVHAQSYQKFLTDATGPLRQSVWPQILSASRGDTTFASSASFFSLMYAGIAFCGLAFTVVGKPFIDLMTHGRFGGAAPYAAVMIAILLLILLSRPQYAVISASGDARAVTISTWVSSGVAAVAILFAVPLWGPLGLLGAVAVRYLVLAACYHLFARIHRKTPFMDGPPLVGAATIVGLTIANHELAGQISILASLLLGAALLVVLSLLLMTNSVARFDSRLNEPASDGIARERAS